MRKTEEDRLFEIFYEIKKKTSVSSSKYLGRNSFIFRSVSIAITSIEFRILEFNVCSAACN